MESSKPEPVTMCEKGECHKPDGPMSIRMCRDALMTLWVMRGDSVFDDCPYESLPNGQSVNFEVARPPESYHA